MCNVIAHLKTHPHLKAQPQTKRTLTDAIGKYGHLLIFNGKSPKSKRLQGYFGLLPPRVVNGIYR